MSNTNNPDTLNSDDLYGDKKDEKNSSTEVKKNAHKYKCFVMMPYGKNDEDKVKEQNYLYDKFKRSAKKLKEIDIDIDLTRADVQLKDFELIESVQKNIRDADFCLADITASNPNVMYEVGFARALDKELIVVTQEENPSPIDVSNHVITKYNNDEIGLEHLVQKLAGYFKEAVKIVELKRKSSKESYNVTCFESGEVSDLGHAFRQAEKYINILESNLERAFKYSPAIEQAMKKNEELELRVLALDPDSYFAQARARQLGVAIAHYRHKLHENIVKMIDKFKEYGGRFSLQVYDDFPTQISFAVDEKIYSCTVARNAMARDLCTFKLSKHEAGVERSFGFHFDSLWSNSHDYQAHTLLGTKS